MVYSIKPIGSLYASLRDFLSKANAIKNLDKKLDALRAEFETNGRSREWFKAVRSIVLDVACHRKALEPHTASTLATLIKIVGPNTVLNTLVSGRYLDKQVADNLLSEYNETSYMVDKKLKDLRLAKSIKRNFTK